MTDKDTDNRTYGTSPEPSRCEHLQRTLCRSDAGTPGTERLDNGATCRKDRTADSDPVQLGEYEPVAGERRSGASCEGTRNERQEPLAERVINSNFLFRLVQCTAIYMLVMVMVLTTLATIDVAVFMVKGFSPLQRGVQATQKESQDKTSAAIEPTNETMATAKSLFSRQSRLFSISTNSLYDSMMLACCSRFRFAKNPINVLWLILRCSASLRFSSFPHFPIPILSFHSPLSLNFFTDYADNNTYEPPPPERNRHVHVLRQVCGTLAGTAGQNRNDNTGTRRKNRDTEVNDRGVGSWTKLPDNRKISRSCKSTENNPPKFTPERVKFPRFSENFEKFFLRKTLEKQGFSGFLGEILENFPKFSLSPIAILENVCYNRGITIGKYPVQKRLTKVLEHFCKPNSKPITTRFTAGLDCIRKGISCKRFIATKERTIR